MPSLDDLRSRSRETRRARVHARSAIEAASVRLSRTARDHDDRPSIQREIDDLRRQATVLRDRDRDAWADADPAELVGQLDGRTPVLLAPLRLQTRFVPPPVATHLRVRVYPDQFSVESHDPRLTPGEAIDGDAYWNAPEAIAAGKKPVPIRSDVWAHLVGRHGEPRARWIRRATAPEGPRPDVVEQVGRMPVTRTLPERLVFRFYAPDGRLIHSVTGAPIPDGLEIGLDPTREAGGFRRPDAESRIEYPPEVRWQFEFEAAVAVGMAVEVPLDALEQRTVLGRITVVGVNLSRDEAESVRLLEELFDDHSYAAGFSLVPQGTPTNATDDRWEEPIPPTDKAVAAAFDKPARYDEACDGVRLAHALGIEPGRLREVPNAACFDGRDAIAVKRALWAGTLGYYLQQMLAPLFDSGAEGDRHRGERLIAASRFLFTHFVFGRGPLPAIRVGGQPYGVLPVGGRMLQGSHQGLPGWNEPFVDPFMALVHDKALILAAHWRSIVPGIARAGAGANADRRLTNVLGLQPASTQFFSERLVHLDYVWSQAEFQDPATAHVAFTQFAVGLSERWSQFQVAFPGLVQTAPKPRIFEMSFFGATWTRLLQNLQLNRSRTAPLPGDVIDDLPLSERRALGERGTYPNYLGWIASDNLPLIRDGHDPGWRREPLTALFFMLARHSYLYDYAYGAMRLRHHVKGTPWSRFHERILHNAQFEFTRTFWDDLEAEDTWPVTPPDLQQASALRLLAERRRLVDFPNASAFFGDVEDVARACEWLARRPTAALERLFTEHVDLAGYRLDAWIIGLEYQRLLSRRYAEVPVPDQRHLLHPRDSDQAPRRFVVGESPIERGRPGIFLGAYGWVEDVAADGRALPVPDELPEALRPADGQPITRDPDNVGAIHAPSLNHAVTAAILRSGSITQPGVAALNVDLSSARVRAALSLMDGVRNGQTPARLLGYAFERALREASPASQQHLPALRAAFPLPSPAETGEPDLPSSARDVVNGLRLVQDWRNGRLGEGAGSLLAFIPDAATRDQVRAAAAGIDDTFDACGDLMLAETVHHAAQGNSDRAGSVLSAAGEFSHIPESFAVVDTLRSGVTVSHRLIVMLGRGSATPPVPTPRARIAPALDAWIRRVLGAPGSLAAGVRFRLESLDPDQDEPDDVDYRVTLDALGVAPIDLLFLLDDRPSTGRDVGEIQQRLVRAALPRLLADHPGRRVREIVVTLQPPPGATRPVGDLLPLTAALRRLIGRARPATRRDFVPGSALHGDGVDRDAIDVAELTARVHGTAARPGLLRRFERARDRLAADAKALADALETAGSPPWPASLIPLVQTVIGALEDASLFGLGEALPPAHLADPPAVRLWAGRVIEHMSERLETAKEDWTGQAENEPDDEQPALLARATRTVESLFGSHIPLLPLTTIAAPPAGTDAPVGQDDIEDWLFTASAVRTGARDLQHVRVLADALVSALPPLRAWQWPPNLAGWIGDGLAAADARAGDLTSVVVQPAMPLAAGAPFAALVADDWQDVIPNEKETTGIAFHYDAPNAEPPQALLLAVSAAALERNMRWTWDELVASVEQALDLAKMRAVEPDQLRATRLDAVLPATIMAEAALPVTISTSLLANFSEKIAEGQLQMWSSIKA